jgi:hypothetical protein
VHRRRKTTRWIAVVVVVAGQRLHLLAEAGSSGVVQVREIEVGKDVCGCGLGEKDRALGGTRNKRGCFSDAEGRVSTSRQSVKYEGCM